jgi:hypothetical protein
MIDDAILALSLSRGLAWWPRKSATARLEHNPRDLAHLNFFALMFHGAWVWLEYAL